MIGVTIILILVMAAAYIFAAVFADREEVKNNDHNQ